MEIFKQHSSRLEEDTITLPLALLEWQHRSLLWKKKIHPGDITHLCLFQEIHKEKVMLLYTMS